MSAKQITVPLEVYVRLQELASLATYSYRDNQGSEENSANNKPWDLLSKDGASILDENGALKPEAAELYFTLLPLIAQEFMEQQQALVDAYRQAPKPAAARAKIRPSNQRLIPLTEVPLENQRIAARIEKEFYGDVPPRLRRAPGRDGLYDAPRAHLRAAAGHHRIARKHRGSRERAGEPLRPRSHPLHA